MRQRGIITITTDFGHGDPFVGELKGRILSVNRDVTIVDLSHDVPRHNVSTAGVVIDTSFQFFPAQTIHLVAVECGSSNEHRPIAFELEEYVFLGFDNGTYAELLVDHTPSICVQLDDASYWNESVHPTFRARDLLATVAGHLSLGTSLQHLGSSIDDLDVQSKTKQHRLPDGTLVGQVVYIDGFGNLITNIRASDLAGRRWSVEWAGGSLGEIQFHYSDVKTGATVCILGSGGRLEISIREGSAAAQLGATIGDLLHVRPCP